MREPRSVQGFGERHETVPEVTRVEQDNGLAGKVQLGSGEDLEELVKRAVAAWQHNEGIAVLHHVALTLGQVTGEVERLRRRLNTLFPLVNEIWRKTSNLRTVPPGRPRDLAHKATATAPVDEMMPPGANQRAEFPHGGPDHRVAARPGPAEYADCQRTKRALRAAHRPGGAIRARQRTRRGDLSLCGLVALRILQICHDERPTRKLSWASSARSAQ